MAPTRILLTGASGFVAGHLVPRLRTDFPAAEFILCGEAHVKLDITETSSVQALVRETRPDVCIHLAAISAIAEARGNPARAWQVNVLGTLALAEAIRADAPGCTLVFASSAEIYGRSFTAGTKLDETAAAAPMNTYAATKAAADLALGAMAADGLRVIRLRPFNHTGTGQTAGFVVPAFAAQVAAIASGRQEPVLKVGNLDAFRDFLDVRDVCAAYSACVARADVIAPGTILNIASGTPRRIGDVLTDLLAIAGVEAEIVLDPARLRPSDIPLAAGNAAAARAMLGWAPSISWETTLSDILADWRARIA
ncbi:MAG: GDP-mannose 4,6-dehydratase [Alphaproteobacteria bacterium]|nr:GDP-mannose 4,6-dehydratase [Alphaproteobacteria bacterium]